VGRVGGGLLGKGVARAVVLQAQLRRVAVGAELAKLVREGVRGEDRRDDDVKSRWRRCAGSARGITEHQRGRIPADQDRSEHFPSGHGGKARLQYSEPRRPLGKLAVFGMPFPRFGTRR
jgi:hypothetical protein